MPKLLNPELMTDADILSMPEDDYMNDLKGEVVKTKPIKKVAQKKK